MKRALGIILISATLATIVLGGFVVSHNSDNHTQCPIAALSNNGCPSIMNQFEFALSHIKTIVSISTGVVVLPFIFLILAASMLFILFVFGAPWSPQINFFTRNNLLNKNREIVSPQKWLSWLSVLEKRDPSIFAAAKI